MRPLILTVAAVAVGLWSLFCWAVYGLLGFAGDLASANIGLLPFSPEIVLWTVGLLGGMGGAAVWIVWGLGVAAIAIVTLIPLAFVPRRRVGPAVRVHDYPRDTATPPPTGGDPLAADKRSADEIVAGVLGRSPRQ